MYSIGELSRETGVKVPTIRFYEDKGLLPEPERTSGNQRRYDDAALRCLQFIRHTRDLGLPLADIEALLTLEGARGEDLNRAHDIAERQLSDLRDRIARLGRLEKELARITKACDGKHDHVCAVLHAFGDHGTCEESH
ncbi:DNA-binding transcriptional regulator, MerR family [Ruegeria halocynthiae]|uniref:DNA-binding transcriptional regulator, MerR family n=1 Tax=Ruegeria halocynthiae TaxID=985054 RepID=A0A1H2UEA9_9RHOB|nr:helix-turn-helix domain-containing protein [Ruegeria halocynthiae]SDW54248.1 DNA-binding transcriptional regulator, MerR family [Ruegeria halocynthiae]